MEVFLLPKVFQAKPKNAVSIEYSSVLNQQPEISEIWRRVTIAFASYEFEKLSKVSST